MVAATIDLAVGRHGNSTVGPQIVATIGAAIVLMGIVFGGFVPAMAIATVLVVGSGIAHTDGTPLAPAQALVLGTVHLVAAIPFLI